jgi:hypothetical protein
MNADAVAGFGFLMVLLFIAAGIFLIMLIVAPIKLYAIHREIRVTNDLLRHQTQLLILIEERNTSALGLLAAAAHVPKDVVR